MRLRKAIKARLSSSDSLVPNKCPRSVTKSGQLLSASKSGNDLLEGVGRLIVAGVLLQLVEFPLPFQDYRN